MGRARGIITRLNAALKRVGPPTRTVYKRVVTRTGGDNLIGRPGSVTYADTACDPQPLVSRISTERVRESAILSGTKVYQTEDLQALFSPTAITLAELQDENLVIALKDSVGNTETYRIVDFDFTSLEGQDVIYKAIIRSVSRP
jgi:hypothetical protein